MHCLELCARVLAFSGHGPLTLRTARLGTAKLGLLGCHFCCSCSDQTLTPCNVVAACLFPGNTTTVVWRTCGPAPWHVWQFRQCMSKCQIMCRLCHSVSVVLIH